MAAAAGAGVGADLTAIHLHAVLSSGVTSGAGVFDTVNHTQNGRRRRVRDGGRHRNYRRFTEYGDGSLVKEFQ